MDGTDGQVGGGQSATIAPSTSSRAARRAGRTAARTPATAPITVITASVSTGRAKVVRPWPSSALTIAQPKPVPMARPRVGAEQGDDHRLVAHRRPQLPTGHADRPQQAELTGALEDRQRQGVGDAEQGDEHRQAEQGVDQVEDHVDLRVCAVDVLVPVLHLGLRVGVGHRRDRRAGLLEARRRRRPSSRPGVEVVGDVGVVGVEADEVVAERCRPRSKMAPTVSCCTPVSANRTGTCIAHRQPLSSATSSSTAMRAGPRSSTEPSVTPRSTMLLQWPAGRRASIVVPVAVDLGRRDPVAR